MQRELSEPPVSLALLCRREQCCRHAADRTGEAMAKLEPDQTLPEGCAAPASPLPPVDSACSCGDLTRDEGRVTHRWKDGDSVGRCTRLAAYEEAARPPREDALRRS